MSFGKIERNLFVVPELTDSFRAEGEFGRFERGPSFYNDFTGMIPPCDAIKIGRVYVTSETVASLEVAVHPYGDSHVASVRHPKWLLQQAFLATTKKNFFCCIGHGDKPKLVIVELDCDSSNWRFMSLDVDMVFTGMFYFTCALR